MAEISAQLVNELRQITNAGLMDCKKALVETNGSIEEAITLLRKKGIASAASKASRDASEGTIECYIHSNGRIGVLLEINCETDFVAKNEEFKKLAKDICMHIAASSPLYVSREQVPFELVEKEKEVAAAQVVGKPAAAVEGIVKGKLDKWYSQICLLEQEFVKNPEFKIQDLLAQTIQKIGENIVVRRFVRYQLGA